MISTAKAIAKLMHFKLQSSGEQREMVLRHVGTEFARGYKQLVSYARHTKTLTEVGMMTAWRASRGIESIVKCVSDYVGLLFKLVSSAFRFGRCSVAPGDTNCRTGKHLSLQEPDV